MHITLTHTIWFFICPLKYLVDMIIDAKTRIRKRESIHGFPFSSVHSNIRLLFGWRLGQFLTRGRATWKLVRGGLKGGGSKVKIPLDLLHVNGSMHKDSRCMRSNSVSRPSANLRPNPTMQAWWTPINEKKIPFPSLRHSANHQHHASKCRTLPWVVGQAPSGVLPCPSFVSSVPAVSVHPAATKHEDCTNVWDAAKGQNTSKYVPCGRLSPQNVEEPVAVCCCMFWQKSSSKWRLIIMVWSLSPNRHVIVFPHTSDHVTHLRYEWFQFLWRFRTFCFRLAALSPK